jgi:K(+)-stimulated pyrophosphate-energized sodium pump
LLAKLSILHAPFLLGLLAGGAVIYWFTGASMQAVITGAYRAVEFIKRNMKLDGAAKASIDRQQERWWKSARSTRRKGCSTSS